MPNLVLPNVFCQEYYEKFKITDTLHLASITVQSNYLLLWISTVQSLSYVFNTFQKVVFRSLSGSDTAVQLILTPPTHK